MKSALGYLLVIGTIVAHAAAIAIIALMFWPFAKWYLDYLPLWGVDFYLIATISELLNNNFVLPHAFWNYAGFAGWPALIYPSLHAYIIYFLSKFLDFIVAIQYWMMVSSLLFSLGAYFLFYVVSRNFVLSMILAIACALSAGVYETLTWAGGLASFATQAALPWVLGFVILFTKERNWRFLLIAALIAGISVWGHPIILMTYIGPSVAILLLATFGRKFSIITKIKAVFVFFAIAMVIGLPVLHPTILNFGTVAGSFFHPHSGLGALSTTTAADQSEYLKGVREFNRDQVARIYTDNNPAPFYLLIFAAVIFVLGFVLTRKVKNLLLILPYILIGGFFWFYIWLFGEGISIYHGGWYRLFWSPPIWVGLLASALFGLGILQINSVLKGWIMRLSVILGATVAVGVVGYTFLTGYTAEATISTLLRRSQASSAYPDILNLKTSDYDREELKKRLVPSWMNGDDANWRFYDGDQTVNIWWNSVFKMPLARGYLDPPTERGYIFWLDTALSETNFQPQLVEVFKYPLEAATSNALFLIDWNAIKYYEGGHTSDSFTPLPKYLQDLVVKREEVLDFNDEKYTKRPVTLNYYEISDEVTSPVLSATNAPSLGIFASDSGYEAVIRAIAERDNLNSQKLIPLKLGKKLDKYSLATLKQFDALYLYDYDFNNETKAVKRLKEYLATGKKVFIETGVEVKHSSGGSPEIFPVKNLERRGLGREWAFETEGHPFTNEIDFSQFSPPVFDEDEWKQSFAEEEDVLSGAKVILKNHGKIVMAEQTLGSGQVIWSGLNFAYHLSRNHNEEEAKLFNNILSSMVDLSLVARVENDKVEFISSNLRSVEVSGARGILFKEQAYDGWQARAFGKSLEIFKAGPANPGFMYIPLSTNEAVKVELKFSGATSHKLMFALSLLSVILIIDEAFGGIFIGKVRSLLWSISRAKINRWWAKEDE